MLKDELVEVVGITHSGRVLSRTYRPTEKAKKAILNHFIGQYSMFRDVIKPEEMCAAIRKM